MKLLYAVRMKGKNDGNGRITVTFTELVMKK